MNAAIRVPVAALVIAAAMFALHTWVAVPYRCSILTARTERLTMKILAATPHMTTATIARANIDAMQECIRKSPTDVNPYLVAAANMTLLGRFDEAAATYEAALRYHRRPELYLNLGVAQLELGQTANAIDSLVRARVFNQWVDDEVPPIVREEVRRRSNALLPDRH